MSEENKDGTEGAAPDLQAESERLKGENKTLQEELKKYQDKDLNFKKVREMTEAEKKKFEEEKGSLQAKITDLEKKQEENRQNQLNDWFDTSIRAAVGDDSEKAAKIKAEYDLLNMPTTTREEVAARAAKAVRLAGFEVRGDVGSAFGAGRDVPKKKDTSFTDTEKGQALYGILAPDLARIRKANEKK